MSELRERKKPVVPANEAEPILLDSEDVKKASRSAAVGSTEERQRSFLSRYAGVIVPIVLTALVVFAVRSISPRYPFRYGVCTFDQSVYVDPYTTVDCVVVNRGAIEYIGSLEETRSLFGDLERLGSASPWSAKMMSSNSYSAKRRPQTGLKIYLVKRGHAVFPGLTDAHGHILEYGHSLTQVSLHGATSIQEVITRITKYINALPKERGEEYTRVIEGQGFDQTKYPGKAFPTAADLDVPELANRKIFLVRVDLHACWISPALLASLDIPDHIPGGVILRDASGQPTGVFLDTAYEWIMAQLPPRTDQDRVRYLHTAAENLHAQGITGVHDAAASLESLAFYQKLDQKGLLPLRIYGMVACPVLDEYCGDQVERYEGGRLTIRSVKLFLDGALGSWGAAMIEPYSDNPTEKGISRMSFEKMFGLADAWTKKGFQVNTHAIGDAANRIAIDVYEKLLRSTGSTNDEQRYRIEHAQIMSREDIARAGELGLISSVQPTHCTSDMGYAESRLGPERVKGAYAWQSLRRAGSPIALGSDFPVEDINPFEGLYSAMTRLDTSGTSPHGPEGWYPEERLTRQQALEGFTTGAAYASFSEVRVGKLAVGMRADLIIVDRDTMKVEDVQEVRKTKVLATVIDGNVVYGKL